MKRNLTALLLLIFLVSANGIAQIHRPEYKVPDAKALSDGHKLCEKVFENLKQGKTDETAQWIIDELGTTLSASQQMTNRNEYISKFDIILMGPPNSSWGQLDSYDLIDESYLPGSDRYFRLVYISYHEEAPLMWEFRYYIKPDGNVKLNYVGWSEMNPFEYLSTSDMLVTKWYYDAW